MLIRINVERMVSMEYICCFCGKKFEGWGNNPYPANKDESARCCDACNDSVVIPSRLARLWEKDNG